MTEETCKPSQEAKRAAMDAASLTMEIGGSCRASDQGNPAETQQPCMLQEMGDPLIEVTEEYK